MLEAFYEAVIPLLFFPSAFILWIISEALKTIFSRNGRR